MNILVNIDALVRISGAASDEMTRHYLHGVHVCARRGVAGAIMVATNGCILACENDPAGEVAANAAGTISISAIKQIQAAAKLFAKQGRIKPGMLQVRCTDKAFKIVWGDVETAQHSVIGQIFQDGSFPAWENVVPKLTLENDGTDGAFNAELISTLAKTMPGKHKGFRLFQQDAGSPAIMRGHESENCNWFGVIMPMRVTVDKALPWFMSDQRAKDADLKAAA